ncbi:BQ5605_C005g03488 [Microbotryum silenes-dioicae]|uniref:BQ5605_C005g03488 protein n=1 Tax=Microbotryum silenes-dioicae TaxID=796604 RepID=A0A2X0PCP1_9BASI|nr:BQ5605_C005g03488 [Microbotryum silenes-dioicae]
MESFDLPQRLQRGRLVRWEAGAFELERLIHVLGWHGPEREGDRKLGHGSAKGLEV